MDTDHTSIDPVDYLIVGQGLAGTMMTYHLLRQRKKIIIVDNGLQSASMVAAGLFNPVTGRRFVKSWLIDELLPCAETVYKDLEKMLGKQFFHPMPIVRFLSGSEGKIVYDKSILGDKQKYISGFTADAGNQYATCEIKGGGYVDTYSLIVAFREYLTGSGMFIEDDFSYNNLQTKAESINWKGIFAGSIIFCEGYKAVDNPFFPGLHFNLAKGEILTVKIKGLGSDKILMSGGYLVPIGGDIYKLGSTYEWDDLTPVPTSTGRETLIGQLKKITDLPFEIINHEAGVRPAVKHRRPLVGKSPIHDNMYILNGMGTKGVILAPFFASQLAGHLLDGKPLDKEVDITFL